MSVVVGLSGSLSHQIRMQVEPGRAVNLPHVRKYVRCRNPARPICSPALPLCNEVYETRNYQNAGSKVFRQVLYYLALVASLGSATALRELGLSVAAEGGQPGPQLVAALALLPPSLAVLALGSVQPDGVSAAERRPPYTANARRRGAGGARVPLASRPLFGRPVHAGTAS